MKNPATQPLYTTFTLLKENHACRSRYRFLAKALGGTRTYGVNKPIRLSKIVRTNGIDDAVFALGCVPDSQIKRAEKVARRILRMARSEAAHRSERGRDLIHAAWTYMWRIDDALSYSLDEVANLKQRKQMTKKLTRILLEKQ